MDLFLIFFQSFFFPLALSPPFFTSFLAVPRDHTHKPTPVAGKEASLTYLCVGALESITSSHTHTQQPFVGNLLREGRNKREREREREREIPPQTS